IYLTTAYPLEGQYKGYVVEIIKDISGSEIVDTLPDENWGTLHGHIENKNIRFVTDQKTGLYNIRYLQEKLPYELINNAGKGYESAVLIVDIDGFKTINTTFGYDAGDAVLKRLAHLLTGCIREDYDWAL
ncbi:GGDEF domain-containing protein, partial [Aduncisulcus paluster]